MNVAEVKTQVEQKSFCKRCLGKDRFRKNGQRLYGYALEDSFLRQQVGACLILFYAEVTKVSLNLWFKLTVTKLNLSTNSLMTLFSVLIKLNHEGRKFITKAENPDSEILS